MDSMALEGIRVVDFTWVWAGPYCTKQLADMGAEVIKIETASRVDTVRREPPHKDGVFGINRNATFSFYNRNKLGCALNLKEPGAVELLKGIIATSDVVIENFAPRVMPSLGLDYDSLKAIRPDIIMVSQSGFGGTGPYRDYVSYAEHPSNFSGLTSLSGMPDRPFGDQTALSDQTVGLMAAFALMSALHHRARTGEGQRIDVSQYEAVVSIIPQGVMEYSLNQHVRERNGNRDDIMAPHGVYRCQGEDQWVSIAVATDAEWAVMTEVMGQPELSQDERFSDALQRWSNQDILDQLVQDWTQGLTHYEVMNALQAVGVAAIATFTSAELMNDPHLKDRDFFVHVDHPEVGPHKLTGPPWKMSDTPGRIKRSAPLLGQDNEYVLCQLLGLSSEELGDLTQRGVAR
ncbi:MAG: CoA transferase [SAR202 cluster bacterium]|jgi:benzylsuccinate CoA-transferase BbsF subunit|nr:CoA transferase [SAR202 cluster bacterium]MDP6713535.1 CoA transferase [SAR202 cluster bacterium]